MPNPKQATTSRSGQRYYTWRDEKFWSVTTILKGGLKTSYGLERWKSMTIALGSIQEAEVIALMLRSCETPEHCQKVKDYKQVCQDCKRVLEWLSDRPYTLSQKARDMGDYIHEAVEAYVLGKPFPKWTEEARPRMESFEAFLAEYEPEFEATEASVYSKQYRYAGTLDGICTIKGRRYVIDLKTGNKGVWPEVALQLAAYRYADFIGAPDGSEKPMPEVDAAAALHLPEAGYELVDVDADEDVHRYFLHIKESFRWQEEKSKQVLRGPLRIADDGIGELGQMLLGEGKS